MFIDIHGHAYLHDCPPQDGHTTFAKPEEVIRRYDELGIEKGVLLPLIGPETYLPQSNEEILEMCRLYPDRFIPFCNIDPRGILNSPDSPLEIWLNWYKEKGVKGIGELMPNLEFKDPRVLNLFSKAEEIGFPVIFDSCTSIPGRYGLCDDAGLPQLEYCLQKFPKLKILGHGPAFWSEIGELQEGDNRGGYISHPFEGEGAVPRLMRKYKNLLGDLSAGSGYSAMTRNPEYTPKFFMEFQDRLLFGTDICRADQDLPMGKLLIDLKEKGKISEEAFRKIAKDNAVKLLGLD